jgi:Na+/H+-dicarboxylate symporter
VADAAKPRLSLSAQVLVGLVLGAAAGVFFGALTQSLAVVGNAFILLLQMTVLPYVVTSLIAGLGRLDMREARTLAVRAGGLLLALWALGLVLVLMLPLAFPAWEAASFFSTALVAERASMDFLQLYIPANPFRSLSETVVPAIVVFSIAFGVALIGIPEKRRLVDALDTMADALMRITQFVVRLAPLGVFAIAAKAAGTLDVDEFGRLQVFVLAHASLALLLAFWLLPGLVAALTPLRHREVLAGTRTALVTAFATGNVLIVLPMLADQTKHLLESAGLSGEGETSSADILVPASFNFPSVGKLLSLGFVPFAGWFVGATLSAGEYPSLAFAGLFSFFGHVVVALPFLLDLFHLPADGFELARRDVRDGGRSATPVGAPDPIRGDRAGRCAGRVARHPRLLHLRRGARVQGVPRLHRHGALHGAGTGEGIRRRAASREEAACRIRAGADPPARRRARVLHARRPAVRLREPRRSSGGIRRRTGARPRSGARNRRGVRADRFREPERASRTWRLRPREQPARDDAGSWTSRAPTSTRRSPSSFPTTVATISTAGTRCRASSLRASRSPTSPTTWTRSASTCQPLNS